ncbi:MAG TPA: UDP-N-acetylmuramoyl-L-alanine--D-glutamate ligase [Phaeodactylibacter sp.]|nr:UDP-N-acetylmuramoyl-L-alanine--D-glutamate ligase [Phaeodactylibacter sp.]
MKAVILGAGESGLGAAILAQQKGYDVFVSDFGNIKENFQKELQQHYIPFEQNKHTSESILDADCIIKSPGIPDTAHIVQLALNNNIPVISEIDFAAKFFNGKIIAITGSNGKTTTTNLTYHLLHTAGLSVGIAGNVGISFARLIASHALHPDFFVLELSSFQLDNCYELRPYIAVLLNITPDHMDRYDYDLDKYIASKFRIMQNQGEGDVFIYNAMDENINAFLKNKHAAMKRIAVSDKFFDNSTIRTPKDLYSLEHSKLKGPHNAFNAACALLVAEELGLQGEVLQIALDTFVNAPHRLELVATIDGVDFINDSKATNVDSLYYALLSMDKATVLILGGIDKGNDYERIIPLVKQKVKAIICLGVDNEKLLATFSPVVPVVEQTRQMQEAIRMARAYANEAMAVLLSPACSSFDLFENYEDRGNQFREQVLRLK